MMPVAFTLLSTLGMAILAIDASRPLRTDVLFVSFWLLTVISTAWLIVQYTRRSTPRGEPTPPRRILSIMVRLVLLCIVLAMLSPVIPVTGRTATALSLALLPSIPLLAVWLVAALVRREGRTSTDH